MANWSRALCAFILACGVASSSWGDDPVSSGTGFAVTADGWLMTNAHVVHCCERVEVKGMGVAADPRVDETNDLALIRIPSGDGLTPIVFRRAPVRLGEDIVAIGYPLADILSDSVKITTGNVNALAGLRNDTRYIQISTPIQPGNSGGPVVDREGFLLGITTATFSKKTADEIGITAQNINFAIRASVADLFMQSQSLTGSSGERAPDAQPVATADLSEKITPSVFQILCYGKPEVQASTKVESAPASLPTPAHISTELVNARGYDAIGFDYRMLKDVSYSECNATCTDDDQCRAITYNTKHRACFLKNNIVALIRNSDAVAAYAPSMAAGVIVSDFTSYSGVDLPGGDYKRIRKSNYLECFTTCISENQCKAFSYIPKKSECWLKSSIGKPRAANGVELGLK